MTMNSLYQNHHASLGLGNLSDFLSVLFSWMFGSARVGTQDAVMIYAATSCPCCLLFGREKLRLSYIAFLLGQNFDGFEQWRALLQLLCSCEDAAMRRTEPRYVLEWFYSCSELDSSELSIYLNLSQLMVRKTSDIWANHRCQKGTLCWTSPDLLYAAEPGPSWFVWGWLDQKQFPGDLRPVSPRDLQHRCPEASETLR